MSNYIFVDVEVISYRANVMKQNATAEQLITFAKSVIRRFGND